MLPTSDTRYTTINGGPKCSRSRLYRLAKKSGNQNKNIHHIGSIRKRASAYAHVSGMRKSLRQVTFVTVPAGSGFADESLLIKASSPALSLGCSCGFR